MFPKALQSFALWALAGFGCIAIGYWLREFVGFRHGFTAGYQKALDDMRDPLQLQFDDLHHLAEKSQYTHGQVHAYRAALMQIRDLEDGR